MEIDEIYSEDDSGFAGGVMVSGSRDNVEPPFVKLYLDNVLFLRDLPKNLNPVLLALLNRMPYGGKAFAINASMKRQMAKELGRSAGGISNAITNLVNGGLLIREDVGLYHMNPDFFGRGEWKDVQALRLAITYDYRGRTFMAQVANRKKQKELDGQQSILPAELTKFEPITQAIDIEYEDEEL